MWLYMINLFAMSRGEFPIYYKNKISRALYSVAKYIPETEFIVNPGMITSNYFEHFKKIYDIMTEYRLVYKDIRINKPFLVSGFTNGEDFIYVVINKGSRNDARLVVDSKLTQATWKDIQGNEKDCNIDIQDSFTCIRIKDVSLPGIVQCQNNND